MDSQKSLEKILSTLTPDHLRNVVLGLASQQSPDTRQSVTLPTIMDALTAQAGVDLGEGAEGWSAQLGLKKAIADMVAHIPGMQFVEGDS
ncbi:MAG: hypothetical protein A2Y73_08130 [Chloroflexi bacterium RBG_13_56_8]|nr:MAG: hypothetical protein A2Y73_08130 [Chloroflexi bacterium RBG_13_56_8]